VEVTVQLGPIFNASPEEREAAILEAVARVIVDEHFGIGHPFNTKVDNLVNSLISEKVESAIRTAVANVIDRSLDEEFTPTNKYGERSPATTIRAEIRSEVGVAAAMLSGSRRDDYARRNSEQFWQKLVGGHVKELVKEEVGGVVAEIRENAAVAVRTALAKEIGVNLKPSDD
jgi:hypothetical protein